MFKLLPDDVNENRLRDEAARLHSLIERADSDALQQVGPYLGDPLKLTIDQTRDVIARSYGYSDWSSLMQVLDTDTARQHALEPCANQFLDWVTVAYGNVADAGPTRFARAARLLEQNPEIRTANVYVAAAAGDVVSLMHCLHEDASLIDRKGGLFGWTPLMYAAYARLPGSSSLHTGLKLLELGADPNAFYLWAGQYRFTALTGVFGQGEGGPVRQPEHPDCLSFATALLEAGADPNDSQAAYNRCFLPDNTWLELLLSYGLRPDERNSWLEHEDGQLVPNASETLHFHLIQSIHRSNASRAQLLIDHGVSLDRPDDTYDTRTRGKSPYRAAMVMGETAIATMLLDAGATDVSLSDAERFESLCMQGLTAAAKAHLAKHPSVLSSVDKAALLHDTVKLSRLDAFDTLMALGFELEPRGGRSVLHEAALTGNTQMVQRLLDEGADPTQLDAVHHQPPIGFARYAGHVEVVALLEQWQDQ